MAKSAPLAFDPEKRVKKIYWEEDGVTRIETRQDAEGLVKLARQMSELPHDREMYPICVVPENVLERSYIEGWFHDPAAWRRWMNDPENRDFRIEHRKTFTVTR